MCGREGVSHNTLVPGSAVNGPYLKQQTIPIQKVSLSPNTCAQPVPLPVLMRPELISISFELAQWYQCGCDHCPPHREPFNLGSFCCELLMWSPLRMLCSPSLAQDVSKLAYSLSRLVSVDLFGVGVNQSRQSNIANTY